MSSGAVRLADARAIAAGDSDGRSGEGMSDQERIADSICDGCGEITLTPVVADGIRCLKCAAIMLRDLDAEEASSERGSDP